MGRGSGWSDTELCHLARAWLHASEDPETGTDQTAGRFKKTMFERFKTFAPELCSEKTYGARTAKAVRAKFDEVSADLQKFRESLRFIHSCNPTGVTEDGIFSMAVAKHLGKRTTMSYDAKDYPHDLWKSHLAFKILKTHPKYSDDAVVSNIVAEQATEGNDDSVTISETLEINDSLNTSGEHIETEERIVVASSTGTEISTLESEKEGSKRRPLGKKSSLRLRANDRFREQSVRNGENIAASLQRRTELLEEKNAMTAYSIEECKTQEDLDDRDEYLRLIRKQSLKRIRDRTTSSIIGNDRDTRRRRNENQPEEQVAMERADIGSDQSELVENGDPDAEND